MEEMRKNKRPVGDSGAEMLAEICRLLLLLVWKISKKAIRFAANHMSATGNHTIVFIKTSAKRLGRLIRLLGKNLKKGIRLVIINIQKGIQLSKDFWNDNNTQEKLRKARRTIRKAGELIWYYTKSTGKALIHYSVAIYLASKRLVINTIPIIISGWKRFVEGCILFGKWSMKRWNIARRNHRRRVLAFRRFRKNKGFKGLLLDTGDFLKKTLDNYMDEEQTSAISETEVEDDIYEEDTGEGNKAQVIGKKLFSSVKNIVDVND